MALWCRGDPPGTGHRQPNRYRPGLAGSLNVLTAILAALGRTADAAFRDPAGNLVRISQA
jgi:hypothetical protein